jgi:hypothetical protein
MHAQVWERGFKRRQDQLRLWPVHRPPVCEISESDQSLAVFARGNFRLARVRAEALAQCELYFEALVPEDRIIFRWTE